MSSKQANILFIVTDQHRAISTACYGPTDARTPNIDRLAESSALFENAYCQYPICTASRQSFLTGRYPGNNGTYQNLLRSIDPWQWTFPGALTRAVYDTALIGKAHCNQNGFLYRLESEEYAHRYWPKEVTAQIQPPLFGLDYRRNAATANTRSTPSSTPRFGCPSSSACPAASGGGSARLSNCSTSRRRSWS